MNDDDRKDPIRFDVLKGVKPEWYREIKKLAPDYAEVLWEWYSALVKVGFDKNQALTLLIAQFCPKGGN
jgi:hypothetical protein